MDTLQGMRVFARVVDSGSFTSAAQALDLSTAQVSRLISDLEAHLQTRLLHRTTRRLALTEAGERYLERCRGILEDIEVAEAEAAGAHIRPCGRLRVQSLMGMGQHHLVPMIARFGALFPDVVIELTLSQRNPDMLEEGQDVLITGERQLPDSEFVAQRLGSIHSVLCASPGYLQQHGVPRSVDDLERHVCLRLQDPAYPEGWIFADEQGERTVSPQNTFMVNVAEVMAQAAKADLGIALLPSYVAAAALRNGELLRVLPGHAMHERTIYALYPSRRYLDAKIRTWVDLLQQELPQAFARDETTMQSSSYWAQ
ncbi:LysR family transcriptional regulator [Pseudomonas aeruginosa]|uniref:LysR family transcriptional regulator n=1 Tax=Pseudomonas aeruginosa TaxID=287 RepID=UPI00106D731F|nr:LysR family transcriptional regulator [Pseudomonas aeruginosa]